MFDLQMISKYIQDIHKIPGGGAGRPARSGETSGGKAEPAQARHKPLEPLQVVIMKTHRKLCLGNYGHGRSPLLDQGTVAGSSLNTSQVSPLGLFALDLLHAQLMVKPLTILSRKPAANPFFVRQSASCHREGTQRHSDLLRLRSGPALIAPLSAATGTAIHLSSGTLPSFFFHSPRERVLAFGKNCAIALSAENAWCATFPDVLSSTSLSRSNMCTSQCEGSFESKSASKSIIPADPRL